MRAHWPSLLIVFIAVPLLFVGLGVDHLWEDEGDTAVLASNILKFGVPKAWDGVTFCDSDKGRRENGRLTMISHPWLQYYVVAAAFGSLGESAFAARFPFVICALATISLVYWLVWRATEQRSAAIIAAGLTTFSAQFLLYARQARNYALYMLLSCALIAAFMRMRTAKSALLFALISVLLFHTQPFSIVLVAVLIGVGFVRQSQRRACVVALPLILLSTLPSIAIARGGYAEAADVATSTMQLTGRLAQVFLEISSVTPMVVLITLSVVAYVFRRKIDHAPENTNLLLNIITLTICAYAFALAAAQSTDMLWRFGLRYAPNLIPLIASAVAILVVRVTRDRAALWLPIFAILALTKIGSLQPWIFWGDAVGSLHPRDTIEAHRPPALRDRVFATDLFLFVRDLGRANPGTLARTCEFLRGHAESNDRVITNYEWEPLYFYTRLPQALKILPDYRVRDAARRYGLPEYVFDVDLARWIVWRSAWEGYQGYDSSQIAQTLKQRGGRAQLLVEFPETIWENRENIHFRRFARGEYLYRGVDGLAPAQIWRIDWPSESPP